MIIVRWFVFGNDLGANILGQVGEHHSKGLLRGLGCLILFSIFYLKWVCPENLFTSPTLQIPVAKVPIMLRSKHCMLHSLSPSQLALANECPIDVGGYFIVNGSEKVKKLLCNCCRNWSLYWWWQVLIAQERMANNTVFVFGGEKVLSVTMRYYKYHGEIFFCHVSFNNAWHRRQRRTKMPGKASLRLSPRSARSWKTRREAPGTRHWTFIESQRNTINHRDFIYIKKKQNICGPTADVTAVWAFVEFVLVLNVTTWFASSSRSSRRSDTLTFCWRLGYSGCRALPCTRLWVWSQNFATHHLRLWGPGMCSRK